MGEILVYLGESLVFVICLIMLKVRLLLFFVIVSCVMVVKVVLFGGIFCNFIVL